MRKHAPLAVDIPSPERDKPAWVKVGVIAAVGFVVGIAWPRLVGVRVGPSAPGEAAAAASAQAAAAGSGGARAAEPPASSATTLKGAASAAAAPSASAAAIAPSAASMAAPSTTAQAPTVTVARGSVLSCKTTDGETKKAKECGALPSLDAIVLPRLRKLASCAGAEGQSGKLSFVATADFDKGRLTYDIGKSSTVGNVDQLSVCTKKEFQGVALGSAAHEHARYVVAYNAHFAVAGAAAAEPKDVAGTPAKDDPKKAKKDEAATADKPVASPGEATVGWEVALVRDQPKTGEVVARLPRGTKVKVGAIKEGWYAIKFGDGFATDGYVYRGAIGR